MPVEQDYNKTDPDPFSPEGIQYSSTRSRLAAVLEAIIIGIFRIEEAEAVVVLVVSTAYFMPAFLASSAPFVRVEVVGVESIEVLLVLLVW